MNLKSIVYSLVSSSFLTLSIFSSNVSFGQCYFTLTGDTTDVKTCKYALENVVWSNLVGTVAAQNDIIKIAGVAAWDADAISVNKVYNNGFVQTIIVETNTNRMIGLNTVNANRNYTDLDYAFYLQSGGALTIYENGTNRGTWGYYKTGDTLRISVMNNTILYIQNNNIIYTSTTTPTLPMFVDISINSVNGTLQDVIVGNGTETLFSVFESNPGASPTYQWKLNGGNVGTGLTTYSNNLSDGDVLECVLTPSLGGCSGSSVVSNTLNIKTLPIDFDINYYIKNDSVLDGSCLYFNENIRWESISSNYVNGSNHVNKSAGANAWDVGGYSFNKVQNGGHVQFVASETNTSRMIGLNAVNANVSYTDIDYAFYLVAGGALNIYENGTNRGAWGAYSTGDTLKIAVVNNEVRYIQNGSIVYTSTIAPSLPLSVDFSINTIGATIQNISVSNPAYGRFVANTVGLTNVNYQWKLNGGNVGSNNPIYTNTSLSSNDIVSCDFYINNTTSCGVDTLFSSNEITIKDETPKKNLIFSVRNDSIINPSCKYAFEEVAWQSISGLTLSGTNNVTKSTGINTWNVGGFSYNKVDEGGFIQTIVDETNTSRMIGLNATNGGVSYTDIDFAFFLVSDGSLFIYENGASKGNWGAYVTGDTLKIAVVDNEVRYIQNGNIVYTSTVTPTLPLYVDMSISTVGGTLKKIYVNNSTYGKYSAFVSGYNNVKYQWKLNGSNVGTDSPTYTNTSVVDGDTIYCELTLQNTSGCTSDTIAYSNKIHINEQNLVNSVLFSIRNDSIIENSCLFANEQVAWQSISGLTLNGTNNVTKSSGTNAWNAGGFSYNKVKNGGFMQTIVDETNKSRMIGLNAVNNNVDYSDIDFAFYLVSDGSLMIYENGANRGNFSTYYTGDTLRIAVINNQVHYLQNGNIIYTSAIAPTLPLYVDMSLASIDATLKNITVYNGMYGKFSAYVNGASSVSYQWKLNGGNVGINSDNYTNTSLADGDIITCELTINGSSGCSDTLITSNIINIEEENLNSFVTYYITRESTSRNGCQYAVEDVVWKNISGLTKNNNNVTKSGGTNSWNAGAFSYNGINSNGFFQFVVSETNRSRMIGLNTSNTTYSYGDIDYCFYLVAGGTLQIYENGSFRGTYGTYATNDTLRIEATGTTVRYMKNNNLIYTSAVVATFPLYVDLSILTVGGTLTKVQVGNATHGSFRAVAQNVGIAPSYQWKLNGVNVGTNSSTYSNDTLKEGDEITCELNADFQNCSFTNYSSNKITIKDNPPKNFIPSFTPTNTTWLGLNTNWYDVSNWSADVPRSGYHAIIPTGLGNYPNIPSRAYIYSMDVANGATVTLTSSAHLSVYDEWSNAGAFTTNIGLVEFKTCVDTSRWNSTVPISIYNMKVNNTKGLVIDNGNMHITNSANFTNGIVYNNSNEIIFEDNTTWSNASNLSFVDGQVQKTGNDAFTFPIGDNSYYRSASISAPSIATDHFTAQYFNVDPRFYWSDTLKDPTIHHTSDCEYWIIDRTNGASNVSVSLSWLAPVSCGVTDLSKLLVARWNGAMWKDHGNGGTTGTVSSGTIVTSAAVTAFSPFTLASTTTANPLPIKLLSFDVDLKKEGALLRWSTETEINNDFFTIERSTDVENWIEIKEVDGAGNSNSKLNYSAFDYSPEKGISYYRLKQTDFNGEYSYSVIKSIKNNKLDNFMVFPNPVSDVLTVKTTCSNCLIKIYSAMGQLIYQGSEKEINTSNWAKGAYEIIIINNEGNSFNTRIIK